MLQITDFSVSVDTKPIIKNISYTFLPGVTALLGHNGSGKSSLAFAIMGHPRYSVDGKILLANESIDTILPTARSDKGIFLSFQNVPEIPGIKVLEYLRTVYNTHFKKTHREEKTPSPFVFRRMVEKLLPDLGIESSFLERELFVGFSGGEKRRLELLQIALLEPTYILLDEIDSGLDIDALALLSVKIQKWKEEGKTIIIITHNFHLLDTINVDRIVIMKD